MSSRSNGERGVLPGSPLWLPMSLSRKPPGPNGANDELLLYPTGVPTFIRVMAALLLSVGLGGFSATGERPSAARAKPPLPPKFVGDFETGNTNQWTWGAQCANTGVPSTSTGLRGTVTVQSTTVGQGKYAAQFDLPNSPEVRNACETVAKRKIGVGTDDYYGLMVHFRPTGKSRRAQGGVSCSLSSTSPGSLGRRSAWLRTPRTFRWFFSRGCARLAVGTRAAREATSSR